MLFLWLPKPKKPGTPPRNSPLFLTSPVHGAHPAPAARASRSTGTRKAGPVSAADITAISSYFKRHVVDKDAESHKWGDVNDPSPGYVAWLLWGGDAGEAGHSAAHLFSPNFHDV